MHKCIPYISGNSNVLSVSDGTNTTSYVYDSKNQLIRENNQAGNFTHTWTYDNAGNILSRKEYAYTTAESLENVTPTDTVNYTYGDEDWGDLLTAYDGTAITYDAIGNPLSDGTRTYTWEHGREMATVSVGTDTWANTYNADGLRTKRTNGATTYDYVYYGGQLMYMMVKVPNAQTGKTTNYHLIFSYTPEGAPMGMTYQGTAYYYLTNLQGDVVGILNNQGQRIVSYTYDAWGNPLNTVVHVSADDANYTKYSTIAELNPLRYRGYVYDGETGLYYLNSRYYNSEIGRFLNADNYPTTGQGLTGNNMFVYCGNNPVSREDDGGEWWNVVIGAVVGAVTSAVSTWADGGSVSEIVLSGVCGAVSGAFAATGLGGVAGQMAVGAITSAVDSGYRNLNKYREGEITLGEAIGGTAVDTVLGASFAAMGADGTDAFKTSNKVAKSYKQAKNILKTKGLHPNVKSTAKATIAKGRKYLWNTTKAAVWDGVSSTIANSVITHIGEYYISYTT